jgi:hypothetical protein
MAQERIIGAGEQKTEILMEVARGNRGGKGLNVPDPSVHSGRMSTSPKAAS